MNAVVIRLRLPDGRLYDQTGKLDFVDQPCRNTDTMMLRGVIANPPPGREAGEPVDRELIDGEFVTVLVEGSSRSRRWPMPRAAVLSDQQGNYVFVVDSDNKVEQRRIQLGQSTPDHRGDRRRPERGRDGDRRRASSACGRASRSSPGPAAPPAGRRRTPAAGRQPHDLRRLRRPAAAGDRHRHRHDAGRRAGACCASRSRSSPTSCRRRCTVTDHLSRRVGRGGRGDGRPAARGAGRRRRQDDLHEVEQRQ